MCIRDRCVTGRRNKYMIKKNILPFKWCLDPPPTSRTRALNIVTKVPGVVGNARINRPETPLNSWRLLIDDNMLDAIVEHTNEKITDLAANYGEKTFKCHHVDHIDRVEMLSLIHI